MLHYFLGRSFPYAIGINFRDDKKQSLEMLVVRDNKFREPKGGWLKEGREYMVVEKKVPCQFVKIMSIVQKFAVVSLITWFY